MVPLACSLFGISNDLAMQVVGVGFIVGVIQDSCETALNSSTDVLYTAVAELPDVEKHRNRSKPIFDACRQRLRRAEDRSRIRRKEMKQNDIVVVLAAFAAYLILMVVIGAVYMKKTKNSEDYFLGGRGLSGWVAALSAQASDMSGWLLMGLPGTVYALGTGQAWIAVGLFLGTVFNWVCISSRLRRYTIVANNSLTLPAYFENRFRDKKRVLLLVSSIVIVIFFLVYTASALSAGGKLFHSVFGIDYHIALAIGAVVILAYTFMGGFMAVCVTDFIQGSLMLVGLLAVPVLAYCFIGSGNLNAMLDESQVIGGHQAYLSMTRNGESSYSFIEIFSQLAWGLGYCGMPHILTRFMAVKNQKELKKFKKVVEQ